MIDVLEFFRIRFSGRPLLLSLALLAVALVVMRRTPLRPSPSSVRTASRALGGVGIASLLAYVALAVYYARDPHFFDYAEPTMTAIAWLFQLGQPIHHEADSAARYAHMYGPMAFIPHGVALRLFGPSIEASKWLGAGAALVSLFLLYLALRSRVHIARALALTGYCALLYLIFRNLTFWTRPEPLQLFCMSAGLYAATRGGIVASLVVGASAGVLLNLKITGPLYSLPVVALLYTRGGLRAVAIATVTGAVAAILPFVVFPNVSLESYLLWVRLSAKNGLLLATLRQNIEWAAFFLLPVLLSYFAHPREARPAASEDRWVVGALLAGICGTVLAASKPGATVYHLVPFLPVICYATASHLRSLPSGIVGDRAVLPGAMAFAATSVVLALVQVVSFLHTFAPRTAGNEVADLRAFVASHPGAVVEMGYGRDDRPTLLRPELVFRSGSYLLDAPAVQEHQLSGIEIPPSTIEAIRACRVEFWLIPQGQEPFSGPNRYPAMHLKPLFSESFRRAFFESYVLQGRTRYYDVWQCRTGAAR
jgi:hypothetical protein